MRKGARTLMWSAILGVALYLLTALSTAPKAVDTADAPPTADRPAARGQTATRRIYSPDITHDPYVVDQWDRSIEALEKACRDSGQFCEQARRARRSVNR